MLGSGVTTGAAGRLPMIDADPGAGAKGPDGVIKNPRSVSVVAGRLSGAGEISAVSNGRLDVSSGPMAGYLSRASSTG